MDDQGLKVPVFDTLVDTVVVLLGVCVREGRIVAEVDELADTVFELVVVAVAVTELVTVFVTGPDRDCEPLPVGVRDGLALAEKVPEELPVLDTRVEAVIVGLPVEVFEELVEPVIVLEPIILRLYILLAVSVFVCRLDTDRMALELLVFEGAADGVTSCV